MKTILTVLFVLILSANVSGGLIFSELPGNDSAPVVSALVNHHVDEVGRFDGPVFKGIAASTPLLNPLPDFGLFDYFAVKAGPMFNLYEVDSPTTAWVTPQGKDLSHLTLYKSMPEPGGAYLLIIGVLGMLRFRRGSLHQNFDLTNFKS